MRLADLPRNDVAAAVRYAKERIEEQGSLPRDDAQVLASLQDDPAELFAALRPLLTAGAPERR